MRSVTLGILALTAAIWTGLPSPSEPVAAPRAEPATVDLTAHRIRIADHPGFVRVVVDFTDGTLGSNDSEAADPDPFPDGRVSVDVRHRRIQAQAPARSAHGVRARITQAGNRIRVRLRARPGRFKYLRRSQLGRPDRVVLDLYKSRPPVAGAGIQRAPDGCLQLRSSSVAPGRIRVSGTARFLFENSFQLVVRDARGRPVGDRIVTVGESGRWRRSVAYEVARAQTGTLEGVAESARDGALDCLVQARVRLRP
jgi:hypothetical protein